MHLIKQGIKKPQKQLSIKKKGSKIFASRVTKLRGNHLNSLREGSHNGCLYL